jgi:hypothetical protein
MSWCHSGRFWYASTTKSREPGPTRQDLHLAAVCIEQSAVMVVRHGAPPRTTARRTPQLLAFRYFADVIMGLNPNPCPTDRRLRPENNNATSGIELSLDNVIPNLYPYLGAMTHSLDSLVIAGLDLA